MTINKKLIIIFLMCAFILSALISCNNASENNSAQPDNQETPENESSQEKEKNEPIRPDLPDMDFGGHEFKYFVWDVTEWGGNDSQLHRDLYSERETGETVNDMVYRRNIKIEDTYNIKISQQLVLISNYEKQFAKSVNAGDFDYDALYYQIASMGSLVTKGYLRNLYDLHYADFTKPWWDKNAINDLSLDHKLFGINSAITTVDKMGAQALVFNKDILRDCSLADPYQMVFDGKWTLDKFNDMLKEASRDLTGDGKMGLDDLWGFFYMRDTMSNFANGAGCFIAQKDNNDYITMTFAGERQYAALEKIFDIFFNEDCSLNFLQKLGNDWQNAVVRMFQGNQGLFMWIRMRECEALRAMETPFGILPVPKYDENQSRYYSSINPYTSTVLGIPVTNTDMDRTGIILEALAGESLYTVQPAYYDITLKGKVTRDDESEKILDLIYANVCYDIGEILRLGGMDEYVYLADNKNRDVASYFEKREEKCQRDIEKIMTAIKELN